MIDTQSNFSRRMLFRLVVLAVVVLALLLANVEFINQVYLERQHTPFGLMINGAIMLVFLLGLAKVVMALLHYMREETALARFVRQLDGDPKKLFKGVSRKSIIARRYNTLQELSDRHARINHSALASTLLAFEGARISFARYVSNILILTGVFGTIVSLSIALVGASNLLDTAQDTANMGLVIHGMSTALSTTITAILCYLFYGYFYIKLGDAQAHLLGGVEEVTSVRLLPTFSKDSASMLHEVAGLISGLRKAAEQMKTVQGEYAEAGSRLQAIAETLDKRVQGTADELGHIKAILRDGFRLPAAGD
jgi:hypothetical protein